MFGTFVAERDEGALQLRPGEAAVLQQSGRQCVSRMGSARARSLAVAHLAWPLRLPDRPPGDGAVTPTVTTATARDAGQKVSAVVG
jgi:hypothetical protein